MTVVADSGPLIHLSIVGHFLLLKQYFSELLIVPQVYTEVVTQGKGRPGEAELQQAVQDGWVVVTPVAAPALVQRFAAPHLSETDIAVVACVVEQNAALVLADDARVRELAEEAGCAAIGSVGILVQARLDGRLAALRPLLDQLVAAGFYLDPQGRIYQDALKRVGEMA